MAKFILSLYLCVLGICFLNAQTLPRPLYDTLIQADEVYLDPINQLYILNNSTKIIGKYDIKFNLLKEISFRQGWNHAVMDVSDPFKPILFYPGDFKILIMDESLSIISAVDEAELNAESTLCHFSTEYLGIYSNNVLKLKNYAQQKQIQSDPIWNTSKANTEYRAQLKKSNDYLYLLRPGIGISRYSQQLFEEKSWLDAKMTKMDVMGDQLYYLTEGQLTRMDTKTGLEEVLLMENINIRSFAVNSKYLIVLTQDLLKIYTF